MIKKTLSDLASELIRFPSTKENEGARKDVIDFVKKQFEREKVFITEFEKNGVFSIIINLKKEKNPTLFLNGHLDVVPAKEEDFIPKIKGNRIYARGSGDMKGAVAVMIEVLKYFSKQQNIPSIGIMLTTDEELGGENGVNYLINTKGYKSKFAIIPDGGWDLSRTVLDQKGILHLKIKAYGKSAHGASPFLGENAIDKLFEYYSEIKKIIPELKKGEWKNSVNLGKISGGEAANKVPDYAEMLLDIRIVGKEEKEKVFNKIQKITGGNVEILAQGNSFVQSKNNPFVKQYAKIAAEEIKKDVLFKKVEGASDARFFSEKDIPTIITGIKSANLHGDNEWVDIKEMERFYNILVKLISSLKI